MSFSLEKSLKTTYPGTDVEQIKKIQREQIEHLDEQIKAKQELKDLIEKNLQKAKKSVT